MGIEDRQRRSEGKSEAQIDSAIQEDYSETRKRKREKV